MLHIRWSHGEVEIEGSHADLTDLHRKLLAFAATKAPTLQVEADGSIDPSPYAKALSRLTVEKAQSLLTAQALNGALYVAAKPELLALLAKTIPHSQEQTTTSGAYHAHFDQASHPAQVHERSAGLTFSVRK